MACVGEVRPLLLATSPVIPHSGFSIATRKMDVDPAFGEAAQVDEDREFDRSTRIESICQNRVFLIGCYQLSMALSCVQLVQIHLEAVSGLLIMRRSAARCNAKVNGVGRKDDEWNIDHGHSLGTICSILPNL